MVKHSISRVFFAPLYIHTVNLLQTHTLMDAERFNIQFDDENLPKSTADKLRYYRYKKCLLQSDIAKYAGIYRTTYSSYESTKRDSYPLDKLSLIAEILEVPIIKLLDDYNRFIYDGQGQQILKLRLSMGLSQSAFGNLYGVKKTTIMNWENDSVQIFKTTWEKLFKHT